MAHLFLAAPRCFRAGHHNGGIFGHCVCSGRRAQRSRGSSKKCPARAQAGRTLGGRPDARRLCGQIPRSVDRRPQASGRGRRVVPRCCLSLRRYGKLAWATQRFQPEHFPQPTEWSQNAWWDRQDKNMVTCTADPDPHVKEHWLWRALLRKALTTAWRMAVPSFCRRIEVSKPAARTRIVTFFPEGAPRGHHHGWTPSQCRPPGLTAAHGLPRAPTARCLSSKSRPKSHPAKADFGKDLVIGTPRKCLLVR